MFIGAEDAVWEIGARPIELAVDPELSALLGQPVLRPVDGDLPAWAELTRPCTAIEGVCGSATVGAGPDLVAPSRPVLDVRITLVDGGSDGSGFSCPEPDTATLAVRSETGEPLDDLAPDAELTMIAYVGASPDAVERATTATSALGGDVLEGDLQTSVYVGFAADRDREGAFRQPSFCVAVELMDAAGNRSERSAPVCVDTLDRDAPTTTIVQGSGCAVMGAGGAPGSSGWLLAGVIVAWAGRRRRVLFRLS
jgi:MYXO-CTERM domain-containing protein